MIASGVEDMLKVPMGSNINFPLRLVQYYNGADLLMGATAEKVAEKWRIPRKDMDNMAYWSHLERVNVWGGALALGHPLGQSGARIIITLLNIMKSEFSNARYGLASLCGAFGNSGALLIEKIN